MHRIVAILGFVAWALLFCPAYASVVINEIAWMGTTVSANDEWIELFNQDVTAVDLTGWRIDADDGSPSILLSGTITGNGYFLMERTDDTTVPDISADMIYVGALSNSGETLRLKDSSGNEVNTVVGGADWGNVGGNNEIFETAQRTGNSWLTGVPTPRAQNVAGVGEVAGESVVVEENSVVITSTSGGSASSKGGAVKSPYPRANIIVEAGEDKRVFAGFPVVFSGSSTGLYNEDIPYATYRWNFGDGAVSNERIVSHIYETVGEYIVTLEVFWAKYHRTDRLSVYVTNPDIVISKVVTGEKGYIELTNRTTTEMDISGWSIGTPNVTPFVFAQNSIILPKKTFILSNVASKLQSEMAQVVLRSPTGAEAFTWSAPTLPKQSAPKPISAKSTLGAVNGATVDTPVSNPPLVLGATTLPVDGSALEASTTSVAATVLWSGGAGKGAAEAAGNSMRWMFIMLMTLLIVVAGFMLLRSHIDIPTAADEFSIIEDIIEGKIDIEDTHHR